ncbi:MAG: hypothetical protein MJ149_02700, partial [Clostridia bacterium]|nr:hypothetical protein [Clostridia bacterium]
MTEDETKIKLIQAELEKHGLTLDDEDFVNFFLRKRAVYTGTLIKGNTTYVYSNLIRPQKMHLHIASFENCGYAMPEIDTMEKWYLYKNASDNPLVFANMDNYSNDILDAFKHAREKGGPVKCDVNGKLFNGEDGNHRLLLLMIHDFIERHSAKTAEEIERVNEKYSMDFEVDFMHAREVIEAIENRWAYLSSLNKQSPYSLSARKYKEFVGFRTEEKIYCAEYSNPIYHYNFNG